MISIYAGRTVKSRYDNRAPVHIGVGHYDADENLVGIQALCVDKEISPLNTGTQITVTCAACQAAAVQMHQQVSAAAA